MKIIILTKGMVSLVDDYDYEYLNQWKWSAWKNGINYYARRMENRKIILMHRIILKIKDKNLFADHIDHNGLNNKRGNLRIVTKSENNKNKSSHINSTSKFLGVSIHNKKWRSRITVNYNNISLGVYKTEKEAAIAYNDAAIKYHGKFANLNIL